MAQGYIPKTVPFVSGDEAPDVGLDAETPVSEGDNAFTATIEKVTIDVSSSNLSAADQRAVADEENAAELI